MDEHRAESLSNYKLVHRGDLVLNRMRAFQGGVGMADMDGIASPDYAVLRPFGAASGEFLAALMKSERFLHEIRLRLRGLGSEGTGTVRTPRISVADLLRVPVQLPTPQEQVRVADVLQASRATTAERIADARQAITLAQERRAALISAAVTGQMDVNERRKPAVEQLQDEIEETR